MKKGISFYLILLLFACKPSGENNASGDTSKKSDLEPKTEEEIISGIREKFEEINQNTALYEVKSKEIMGESTEGGELKGYFQNDELKKVVASNFGEMGKSIDEYYFSKNNVFFVFTQQLSYDRPMYVEGSKVNKTEENRYYFHNGKLVRWLDSNKEKVANSSFNQKESEIFQKIKALMKKFGDAQKNEDYIDVKSLFSLSPLSMFDETTEGLTLSEKNDLLKKGESASWKITDESKSKLTIQCKYPSSEVTLRFLKNKDNLDGLLFAAITNEKNANLLSWKYSDEDKRLQKADVLKKYSANAFVSKEDKLPNSYKPVLHYQFIDNQTIEVLLNTWMQKEFENREIANRIFLKWNGENFDEKIVKNGEVQEGSKFRILSKSNYNTSKLNHEGKILNKRLWQDANGENIALFTRKGNELYLYHYAINSGKVTLLRKVYDYEKDCDYDLTLEFIENSIKVTDLDNNNFGELTFAYKKACISDVSPKELKLIMLENGNKFILRGRTTIHMGKEKIGGEKTIDASFKNAPSSFLSHANEIWGSINK